MNLATYPYQVSSVSYSLQNAYVGLSFGWPEGLNFCTCFELQINNI